MGWGICVARTRACVRACVLARDGGSAGCGAGGITQQREDEDPKHRWDGMPHTKEQASEQGTPPTVRVWQAHGGGVTKALGPVGLALASASASASSGGVRGRRAVATDTAYPCTCTAAD